MKLVIFLFVVGIIALAVFGIKKLIAGMKVEDTLVTYNGRTCGYWELRLWPDEYIHGWVFKTAKLSPRIDIRTGFNQEITPPQAASVLDWIFENYPVTSNGATLESCSKRCDNENHQNTIIWRFSKAPAKGITAQTQKKLIDNLLAEYVYIHVDKWPLKPEAFIDDNQERAKQLVLDDYTRKGF